MKILDTVTSYNNIVLLVQRIIGLVLPFFIWWLLPELHVVDLSKVFVTVFILQFFVFGHGKAIRRIYHDELSEGNHKHEFRALIIAMFLSVLLIVGAVVVLPYLFRAIALQESYYFPAQVIFVIAMLKEPMKEYNRTKIRDKVVMASLVRNRIVLVFLLLALLAFRNSSHFSLVVLYGFAVSHFMEFVLTVFYSIEVYATQKYKVLYEDSQRFKEIYRNILQFLFVWIQYIPFIVGLGWLLLHDALIGITEYSYYIVVVLPLLVSFVKMLLMLARCKMQDIESSFDKKNYSGLEKTMQITFQFIMLFAIPFVVYILIYNQEIQTLFGVNYNIAISSLLILFLSLTVLSIWYVTLIKQNVYVIVSVVLAVIFQLIFSEYLVLLYGVIGTVYTSILALGFIWLLNMFVLHTFTYFEWTYFLRKSGMIGAFAVLEGALLYGLRYLLNQTLVFSKGNLQEWMMLLISFAIVVVLVYALMLYTGIIRLFTEDPITKEHWIETFEEQVMEEITW